MDIWQILGWLVFGFVVGLLARAIMPGRQKMGLITTTLLGVAGSLLGGFAVSTWQGNPEGGWSGVGFLGSLGGALVLLILGGMVLGGSKSKD
jgi:uncharacterized membrane protein YeaQ/YmgE (transglycosylase-associated protein family)